MKRTRRNRVFGAATCCLWIPVAYGIALALPGAAPAWSFVVVLALVAAQAGFAGAYFVGPLFASLVAVVHLTGLVLIARNAWSSVQPGVGETLVRNLVWLVPWFAGVALGAWLLRRRPSAGPLGR